VTCIRLSGGINIVRDSEFHESGLNSGPLLIEDVDDTAVDLSKNNFNGLDYLTINRAGSKTIQINGQGNTCYNGWAIVNGNVTGVSGNLQPKRGISTYTYAANDLHLKWNGDTFEIDEATEPLINNIYFDGQVQGARNNAFLSAVIRLKAIHSFTLGNTGNVIANSEAVMANHVVTLEYFKTSNKWVEVERT